MHRSHNIGSSADEFQSAFGQGFSSSESHVTARFAPIAWGNTDSIIQFIKDQVRDEEILAEIDKLAYLIRLKDERIQMLEK